jgi:hypothetical protein
MEQVRNDPPSGVTIDDYVSFFCIVSFNLFFVPFIWHYYGIVALQIFVFVLHFKYLC